MKFQHRKFGSMYAGSLHLLKNKMCVSMWTGITNLKKAYSENTHPLALSIFSNFFSYFCHFPITNKDGDIHKGTK